MKRLLAAAGCAAIAIAGLAGVAVRGGGHHTQPAAAETVAPAAYRLSLPGVARDGTPPPGVRYTVQAGDNLYAIAMRFGTTSGAVMALNGLKHPNQIAPGQVITVLAGGSAPSPTPAPTSATVVRLGDASRAMVAFSFDAGSDVGYASSILDTLAANGILATFGMTGLWAEKNPEVLRRIVQSGHQLINHSYNHPDFTTIGTEARRSQLDSTDNLIVALTGIGTRPYFRPPYGAYDASVNADLAADGYTYSLMWTVDSLGWNGLSAGEIIDRCLSRAEPGAIYLFHVGAASQDGPALQAIIDGLRARGYTIGSVAAVMGQ